MIFGELFDELEKDSKNTFFDWFKSIMDAVNDGVLIIDANGKICFVNDEYIKITGVVREEVLGKYLADVRPGAVSHKLLEKPERLSGVYRKVGDREYLADLAPIYLNGEVMGVVAVFKSLTEVHNLSKELERSNRKLAQLKKTVNHLHQTKYTFKDIVGDDPALLHAIELSKRAASSDLNILIQGESGTGKELFAQAIHKESLRSNSPFIAINCSAIPSALLESELFGYEEGSFTTSKRGGKMGLFELADGGTLFLDEIGDMPFELQAKILRVLQEGRFRKIGGLSEGEIDVRIIAATNKDLLQMAQKNRFREDLYYRLNAVNIAIPPLRTRKGDISLLINHILNQSTQEACLKKPYLTEEAQKAMHHYDWPGNIRELNHSIQHALIMADEAVIQVKHLPESIRNYYILMKSKPQSNLKGILRNTEREVIIQAIQLYGHDLLGKRKAAKHLGISLATLYNKMKDLEI
ncbi:sigma-54 interaction domain-containing protein [Cytobacillus oceanisediminis]|uniref:sigma-54 interaction domain-containing protein n=1 Tax=Cytobacillus oceanisediminis TaxID=665099 RepID=UPI003734E58F